MRIWGSVQPVTSNSHIRACKVALTNTAQPCAAEVLKKCRGMPKHALITPSMPAYQMPRERRHAPIFFRVAINVRTCPAHSSASQKMQLQYHMMPQSKATTMSTKAAKLKTTLPLPSGLRARGEKSNAVQKRQ